MPEAFLCEAVRTPIGRFGGALGPVRADDLAAHPIRVLKDRLASADWAALDEIILGCANQAGEDNRNVARMAALLAGLPDVVPGATINRLCGSGLDAIGTAARGVRAGEIELRDGWRRREHDARAVRDAQSRQRRFRAQRKSMTRRSAGASSIRLMKKQYGVDSMPETAENVAEERQISRADQDAFALRSQATRRRRDGKRRVRRGDRAGANRRQARRDHGSRRKTSIRAPTRRWKRSPNCLPRSARTAP